jgi:hypothetical protein
MRPIRFVKYYDKGSTDLAGEQIAAALRGRGFDAETCYGAEAARRRGSLLVFIKTSRLHHLVAARLRANVTVLDVHDTPVFKRRLKNARLFDGAIFRNLRQLADLDRPGWTSRRIYHQWDERYGPHRVPAGELRVAFLGDRRSMPYWERLPGVSFVDVDWFGRAPEFNCHLSVRAPGREWLYKPTAKVSTAAACRAVLITTPDESSRELLGDDYPFYCEPGPEGIEAAIARARVALDGPEWKRALARLDEVRERTRMERVIDEYLDYFGALEERAGRRGGAGGGS